LSDHLSSVILSALADGELSADQLANVNEHLARCSQCTSDALVRSLLKLATARAGQRYTTPPYLRERMARLVSEEAPSVHGSPSQVAQRPAWGLSSFGWVSAAALLLVCASVLFIQRWTQRSLIASKSAGLVTEVSDQHIATLAANALPEVISSDRHTVKPWFQGKIPFSFNLPQNLPEDTTLDGANLTYLGDQPTAQLLFSVGKHRVSVFVRQKTGPPRSNSLIADHLGFHVAGFRTDDLEVVAVSDVDAARLADLVGRMEQVQAGAPRQPK
jgi:anti-sigma factor RsiW